MRADILHRQLAIDVAAGIRNQEAGEIGKLAVFANAPERIAQGPIWVAAF
jgi:hypothetical protein